MNMHGFVGESQNPSSASTDSQPISSAQGRAMKKDFVKRFIDNLEEFNKNWEEWKKYQINNIKRSLLILVEIAHQIKL